MTSIGDVIRRSASRVAGFWEAHSARSRGRTYEAARAELGDAPWREVPKSTDAWYILDEEAAAMVPAAERGRLRLLVVGLAVAAAVALLALIAATRPRPAETLPTTALPVPAAQTVTATAATVPATPAAPLPAPARPLLATGAAVAAPTHRLARAKSAHHAAAKVLRPKHARR